MEHKAWGYDEFPEFTEAVEGAVRIPTTGEETGVRYLYHVEYANVNGTALHLELLLPHTRNERSYGVTGKKPCIVFVQGSAWMKQDVFMQIPDIANLARKGYVIAIAEYRHSGIAAFPAQIIDIKNAIRFLKKNADAYQINPNQMILSGDSSGGHTAVFACLLKDDDGENLFPGFTAQVNGIINYYGSCSVMREDANPTTMNYRMPDSPEGLLLGGCNLRERSELREKISVECYITEKTDLPPVLMFHGTKDRLVNAMISVDLYKKMKECGKDVELFLIEGGDHGGPEFWTPQVIDITDRFIRRCLKQSNS